MTVLAALAASFVVKPIALDPARALERPLDKVERKGTVTLADAPLLGTLVDTHSTARLSVDEDEPSEARFEMLLADPVLGKTHPVDPTLLSLVRTLVRAHPLARVEVVSGFRSPKLNEALRKKGHHVASHSQHTLGHALDMRVVPDGASEPLDPQALADELRTLGWKGGVGIYLQPNDRFVHADVGPLRTWYGQ
jgi:uncharacterized protein YcbK (DUF882 family)